MVYVTSLALILLVISSMHPSSGEPQCNLCVKQKFSYWNEKNTYSQRNRNYFVCKFAEDARRSCKTDWDCVGWFVGKRNEMNDNQEQTLQAGRDGWNRKGCEDY